MKKLLFILTALVLTSTASMAQDNQQNPRGIYKMTTLTGKLGEIKAPFDQYKICTDSITLMASFQNGQYNITCTDSEVFNYTGEQPKDSLDHRSLIYDSNAQHFTLKWWSTTPYHLYFPDNGWCLERYESGVYSDDARPVFDVLTQNIARDPRQPLVGTWRQIGMMDELRDVKNTLNRMRQENVNGDRFFTVITHDMYFDFAAMRPNSYFGVRPRNITLKGKDTFLVKNMTSGEWMETRVKWLGRDCFAMEIRNGWRTDYQIYERVTGDQPLIGRIASQFMKK